MSNNWKYWDKSGAHEWVKDSALPAGADLFKADFLNQFVDAINERIAAAGVRLSSGALSSALMQRIEIGDDVQLASLYNGWWDKIAQLVSYQTFIRSDDIPAFGTNFDPYWTSAEYPTQPDLDIVRGGDISEYEVNLNIGDEISADIFLNFRKALEVLRVVWCMAAKDASSISGYYEDTHSARWVWNGAWTWTWFDGVTDEPTFYPNFAFCERRFHGYSSGEDGDHTRQYSCVGWRLYCTYLFARVTLPVEYATRSWVSRFALLNWWWYFYMYATPYDWDLMGYNLFVPACTACSVPDASGNGSWSAGYANPFGSNGDVRPYSRDEVVTGTGGDPDHGMGSDLVQFLKLDMIYE